MLQSLANAGITTNVKESRWIRDLPATPNAVFKAVEKLGLKLVD